MGSTQGLLVASECCLLGAAAELGERIFILDPSTGNADQFLDFNDGRRIHDIEFIPQQMYVVHGGARLRLHLAVNSASSTSLQGDTERSVRRFPVRA